MEKVKIPILKRIFDVSISLATLLLLTPFIVLVVLAMLVEFLFIPSSRGSIFYSEKRISEGKEFMIYKFRIFKRRAIREAQAKGKIVHTKDLEQKRSNLTFVGRVLRLVYMDELPQMVNVLKGEMTLVGPRPTNIENYQKLIDEGKCSKYLMKAGLTGYFQSQKGTELAKSQEELDMEYINFCKNSPGWKVMLYDIKIICITIKTIFKAEGI